MIVGKDLTVKVEYTHSAAAVAAAALGVVATAAVVGAEDWAGSVAVGGFDSSGNSIDAVESVPVFR